MQRYSPLTYYTLGICYPRDATRRPYPRRRRRAPLAALYRRPMPVLFPGACEVARRGETNDLARRGETVELAGRGQVCELEVLLR